MTTVVSHFGIHRTPEGIIYLHQGGKSENFIRLSEKSPFEVRLQTKKPLACPHLINASTPMPDREHWKAFMEIFPDELVQELLPVPRSQHQSIPFISDCDDMLLVLLSRMSSPIPSVVQRFDTFRNLDELQVTNACPLVLTHIDTKDQMDLEKLVSVARRSPRKLILEGNFNMVIREPMRRIHTHLHSFEQNKLFSLPMENLGAVAMRRWARGEQIDSPWER